ncbi:MAG: dihydrolipoamide acetyltransferase family protein [Bacteroidales bacterium]|jgi:pyruvate dehydrogenase E2 component (dihydrolipoamide acetyltransferase)|nr:dihydrolipoamide acetyltransferase family protein [Bacteroidales bacterium]
MRYIFKFPDIGEGLEEGTIVEWHVEKGQSVKMGDSLVTMETDKVVTAIPSPRDGIIAAKFGKVGETIHVGSALVEIDMAGVEGEAAVAEASKAESVEEEGAGVVGTLEVAGNSAVLSASKEGVDTSSIKLSDKPKRVLATPVARALAKESGIDINQVKGTGPAGRVTKEDIVRFASDTTTSPTSTGTNSRIVSDEKLVEMEPLSQIRKTIAKNMIQSKHNAAHMTVFEEVEISELDKVRKRYKERYANDDVKLTYLAFIIKATALSLKKYRALNAEMDMEKGVMIYKKYYNIGIAIDTPKGLVVPVIRDADKISIKEIAKEIQILSDKAKDGKLTLNDMKDGTFSITSYGSIGGLFAVPVINYPQAGILGIGRINKKPIVKNDQVVPGLVLPLSLSVDHRIADGGETARFINTIMGYLEDPVSLIME